MNFTTTMRVFCRVYVVEVLWYLLEMSAMLWNKFIPMHFFCRLARHSATVPSNRPYILSSDIQSYYNRSISQRLFRPDLKPIMLSFHPFSALRS